MLVFTCQTNFAQPFGEPVSTCQIYELHYENSSGEKGITYFRYNHQNKMSKAKWTLEDKSRYSTNFYDYDVNGNIVSAYREFSDSLTSYESFCYDDEGNKISEFFYRSDGISGTATYSYADNRLQSAVFKNYKGWLSGTLEWTYNPNNQKEKGTLKNKDNIVCTIYFDYDKEGNLTKEFWDFNGKWSQTFRYTYVQKNQTRHFYSSPYVSVESNFRIRSEDYTFNNEIGGPSRYYYDASGLLAKKVFTRSDNLETNTLYTYDTAGRLVSSKRIYSDSSIATFTYAYDENDNQIRRDFHKADTLYGMELYFYNTDNELIKAYIKNFDGWLTGIIDFTNDDHGKIVNGEFKGEKDINALIDFNYSTNNLVSDITWKFPSGKFQKYHFEYEQINVP